MDLVLVGDDWSDDAAVAVAWASRFATERDIELASVHVSDADEPVEPPSRDFRSVVRDGHPAVAILEAARELNANVIVLGRRGRGGFRGLPMGGIANQVAAMSPLPVIVVPVVDLFGADELLRQVVVGIDGLPEASDAAVWAARNFSEAHFTALHALELAPAFSHLGDEPGVEQLYDRAKARATERMRERWCRPFVDAGVSFDSVVEEGGAVEVLLATVTRIAADLVVVSRRDRHLRSGTLGGVGQRVLSYASCAAAMVPSPS
jgi:nucleotide-binding universal stress UspA family protein